MKGGESFTLFTHGAIQSSESFQQERQTEMKEQNTSVKYTRSEIDTFPDETDWERVDALTDEDIDAAAASDPDAPPTDTDFWKDATVVMPENSTDLQNYYLDGLSKIINELVDKSADGNYIYRGESRCYPKISSTLYRDFEPVIAKGQYTIEQIQDLETQRARDYIRDQQKQAFEIASELQHYGGRSNLMDFTTDYNIALYFACAKLHGKDGHDEDGRVVLLQQNQETIAKYRIQHAQYPANRVQAQKSIFVRPPDGFMLPSDKDVKTVCIPKELKQWILIHLYRFQDISYETLFNDLYGFINQDALSGSDEAWQPLAMEKLFTEHRPDDSLTDEQRQRQHERTVKAYIKRIEYSPYNFTYYIELANYHCFNMLEYDCAIETFSKAILLNPDYVEGYIGRGAAYELSKDTNRAYSDFIKTIELRPRHSYGYIALGMFYGRRGDHNHAMKNYQHALELDPSNSQARKLLQGSGRRDIAMPQLSEKAVYLLDQAAADPERQVEHFNLEQGVIVLINGKDIIQEDLRRRSIRQDRRETVEAEWESALRELESVGYLERVDAPRPLTLFRVTDTGYQHAFQSDSSS